MSRNQEPRYTCPRCRRRVPWSQGCDDGRCRELCDRCWVEIEEGPSAPELVARGRMTTDGTRSA